MSTKNFTTWTVLIIIVFLLIFLGSYLGSVFDKEFYQIYEDGSGRFSDGTLFCIKGELCDDILERCVAVLTNMYGEILGAGPCVVIPELHYNGAPLG